LCGPDRLLGSISGVAGPVMRALDRHDRGVPGSVRGSDWSLDRARAGSYVLGRRTPAGGYCFYRTPQWGVEEPNAPDTLAALECLTLLGIDPPEPEATGRWLQSLQTQDGGYSTFTIGWATLRALGVLGVQPSRLPDGWLERWAEQLLAGRKPSSDWRAALTHALQLIELLTSMSAGLQPGHRDAFTQLLDVAHGQSGGWMAPGVDLESAGVAVSLISLGRLPGLADPGLATLLHACEDETFGLRFAPGTGMTSAGALWGGLTVARALGLPLCYPHAIAANLALLQREDGGFGRRHTAISTLHDTWLGVRAACLLDSG